MISIQTNTDSLIAQQNLNINHSFQSKTIQQLTSGFRINSSADDAAGLAIANSYRSKIAELSQGVSNANNGVSQLQIVDGGLSNISTILDRMKTLATQSASQTFTGNRSVLNQEYVGLLSEINRQATNVNLNSGGSFNSNLSVYIGGANTSANAAVQVDLSGSANAVDSTSLGLSSSSVVGGGASISGNTQNLNTVGATFVKSTGAGASDNQTFTFNLVDSTGVSKQIQASVAATATGSTLNQVLTSLNSQLNASGISAGVDSNGSLQFSGATAFTVSDNATQTAATISGSGTPPPVTTKSTGSSLLTNQVATSATDTTTGTAQNTSNYLFSGASAYSAPAAGSSETISFKNGAGDTFSAKLTSATTGANSGDTLAHALASINQQTASYGVYAVANSTGTGISFQSANSFTITDSAVSTSALNTTAGTATTNFTTNQASLATATKGSNAATPTATNFAGASHALTGTNYSAVLGGATDQQKMDFTIAGVNGGNAVTVAFNHADVQNAGVTDGASLLAAIQTKLDTTLAAADSTNYKAGDIKAGFDASGYLAFSSSSTAVHPNALFSIVDKGATTTAGGATAITYAAGTEQGLTDTVYATSVTGTNNQAQKLDMTYTANANAATTVTIGGTAITIGSSTSVGNAVASINKQLTAAGVSGIFASLDSAGTGINFQSLKKFNVGGSTLAVSGSSTNAFLDSTANPSDKQTFTFNLAGQSSPVTLTLAGTAGGYTGATAITQLTTNIAANAALTQAGVVVALDANNQLKFSSPTAAFTVKDNNDSAGDGLTAYAAGNTNTTGVNTAVGTGFYDKQYTAPTAATVFTVGTTNVNLAAGDNVATAVSKINSALQTANDSTTVAAVDAAGTGIQFNIKSASAGVTLGGSSAGTVFANSTAAPTAYTGALGAGDGITSTANANAAINAVNSAISALGLVQGSIGAGQNKLQYAISLAQSQISNFSAAQSSIRDTDVAQQAANLTKSQVLSQTSIAAMAQANSEPQSILKLLQ